MPVHGEPGNRYTLTAWYRSADGRDYALPNVEVRKHDEGIRLYRRLIEHPSLYAVPEDAKMYVVGPLTAEQKVGRGWRYVGTPGPTMLVIEDGERVTR